MSYGQMRNNITMIDALPDLQDLERDMQPQAFPQQGGLVPDSENTYKKFIRGSHQMNPDSGMVGAQEFYQQPQPQFAPQAPPQPYPQQPFNCIDIVNHVQGCPICSRFYSNDKTLYIVIIVLLTIVALLLLKRVLNI